MAADLLSLGRRLIAEATPGLAVPSVDDPATVLEGGVYVCEHVLPRDATLHVFAVNNLPALLDVYEAAREARELARHRGCCAAYRGSDCDCGLAALDARLAALEEKKENP